MSKATAQQVRDWMKDWRKTRGWWYCIDCGARINEPHPMAPPEHYMCPVYTKVENDLWVKEV